MAAHLIWERLGDVPNFVEPFAGSLATLLRRPHAPRIETVNDFDAFISNFWRATASDPEGVVKWCDYPIHEDTLHARHLWLVKSDESAAFRERMKVDPDFYDIKIAGWWVWGISQWIGGGWCDTSRARPAQSIPALSRSGQGVHRKLPLLSHGPAGVHRKLPSLSNNRGVHATASQPDGLLGWFKQLQDRLRYVRVACGDWSRVVTPAVTVENGLTGILLDPPYDTSDGKQDFKYTNEEAGIAQKVRDWAVENGDNPMLRIALCGYSEHYEMPDTWAVVRWKANGGYSNQGKDRRDNPHRERIWFSPHCLQVDRHKQISMFGGE